MTLLALERVSKCHWRGRHEIVVLDEVSLEVGAGELVAVFGQRAAGKTTLLRIAAGIEAPDAGCVRFEGRELGAGRFRRFTGIHARIGWVGRQGPFASGMRMLDHVALPLLRWVAADEAERRATRALKRVGAGDLAGARWHELSDAERTLVTVAHAIVRDPSCCSPTIRRAASGWRSAKRSSDCCARSPKSAGWPCSRPCRRCPTRCARTA